jgi:hypothetical protein
MSEESLRRSGEELIKKENAKEQRTLDDKLFKEMSVNLNDLDKRMADEEGEDLIEEMAELLKREHWLNFPDREITCTYCNTTHSKEDLFMFSGGICLDANYDTGCGHVLIDTNLYWNNFKGEVKKSLRTVKKDDLKRWKIKLSQAKRFNIDL